MNKFINFKLPEFQEKYGQDWTSFKTIVDETVDYFAGKIYSLVYYNNINTITEKAIEIILKTLGIQFSYSDTFKTKKIKLRTFVKQYKEKGMEDFYLDLQEEIFGLRGIIYTGISLGTLRWGHSTWSGSLIGGSDIRWTAGAAQFEVYIDCQTDEILADNSLGYLRWGGNKWDEQRWQDTAIIDDLLDRLVALYRQKSVLPAFYKIYLINASFDILRTV